MTRQQHVNAFVRKHGMDTFRKLIYCFENQESGQAIALQLGVTRQQVSIWRRRFGETLTYYCIDPSIQRFADSLPPDEES